MRAVCDLRKYHVSCLSITFGYARQHDLVKTGATVKDPVRTHQFLQSVADMHAGILCARPIIHNDLKNMNVNL
jgi:hypothetical protein